MTSLAHCRVHSISFSLIWTQAWRKILKIWPCSWIRISKAFSFFSNSCRIRIWIKWWEWSIPRWICCCRTRMQVHSNLKTNRWRISRHLVYHSQTQTWKSSTLLTKSNRFKKTYRSSSQYPIFQTSTHSKARTKPKKYPDSLLTWTTSPLSLSPPPNSSQAIKHPSSRTTKPQINHSARTRLWTLV